MPARWTLATLPTPNDPNVTLREVPGREALREGVKREGLKTRGEPTWARYDPPFMPWFLRTNEVHLELAAWP